MNTISQKKINKPEYYGKKRMSAAAWTDAYINKCNKNKAVKKQDAEDNTSVYHSICISRQVGAGALDIADLLSEIIHYRIINREILDYLAKNTHLAKKIIEFYDEQYPGEMSEFLSRFFNKKIFIKSDYERQLVKTVNALANIESTIFVGRGTHLILPRNDVLSVRLLCSKEFRVERLSNMLNIGKSETESQLNLIDAEQHEFFMNVYKKKETSLDQYDLVINRDHIKRKYQIAQIIAFAFKQKFGSKI